MMYPFVNSRSLKFVILSETSTVEPFFVLVLASYVNWKKQSELRLFLTVLYELIEEAYLTCAKWDHINKQRVNMSTIVFDDLLGYVESRLQKGEALDEVPEDYDEYEFHRTRKGNIWIEGLYSKAIECGSRIISKLEEYKNDNDSYPKHLCNLIPQYLPDIENPAEVHGCWWYQTDDNLEFYCFGFMTLTGHIILYDKNQQRWPCD